MDQNYHENTALFEKLYQKSANSISVFLSIKKFSEILKFFEFQIWTFVLVISWNRSSSSSCVSWMVPEVDPTWKGSWSNDEKVLRLSQGRLSLILSHFTLAFFRYSHFSVTFCHFSITFSDDWLHFCLTFLFSLHF